MPSRRQHIKSRHGCFSCKSRRVKCDFQRPVCGHCSRRKERCRFPSDVPEQPQARARLRYPNMQHFQSPIYESPLNREQLLLHHFSSKVSLTLSDRPDYQTSWSLYIPRDGYDYPYLMHSMLAISALHIFQTTKDEEFSDTSYYRDLAVYHHDLSLSVLRQSVAAVTVGNFDALYASTMLVLLFNIVLVKSSTSSRFVHDIAALCELAKGTLAVRQEAVKIYKIQSSHLMRQYRAWNSPPPLPETMHRTLKHIENLVQSLPDSGENKDQYIKVTGFLRMTLNAVNLNPDHPAMIFMWFTLVDRQYTDLLRAKDTMALLILAHYGICILQVKERWWAVKFGRYIVTAVHDILDNSEDRNLLEDFGTT